LGVAVVGHVLVFGALSLGLMTAQKPPIVTTPPVDIQIVDEVAERDQAPDASQVEPAPSVAPEVGPPVADAPTPPVAEPKPQTPAPRPAPAPPKVAPAKPAPIKPTPAKPSSAKSAPPKPNATKPTPPRGSRLGSDFLKGIADRPTASTSDSPRAAIGQVAANSIGRLVREQLKPHWKAPTGADAELLRTELSISLSRNGQVSDVHVLRTTGQTDSNKGQVRLHQEAAMKAVRLAAPFTLPPDLYDAWKLLEPVGFDKRLAQ
jgi:hypothetical protein